MSVSAAEISIQNFWKASRWFRNQLLRITRARCLRPQQVRKYKINHDFNLLPGKNPANLLMIPSTRASGQEAPLVIKILTGLFVGKKSIVNFSCLLWKS